MILQVFKPHADLQDWIELAGLDTETRAITTAEPAEPHSIILESYTMLATLTNKDFKLGHTGVRIGSSGRVSSD